MRCAHHARFICRWREIDLGLRGRRNSRLRARDRVDTAGQALQSALDDILVARIETVDQRGACLAEALAGLAKVLGRLLEALWGGRNLGLERRAAWPERLERVDHAISEPRRSAVEKPSEVAPIVEKLADGVCLIERGVRPAVSERCPLLLGRAADGLDVDPRRGARLGGAGRGRVVRATAGCERQRCDQAESCGGDGPVWHRVSMTQQLARLRAWIGSRPRRTKVWALAALLVFLVALGLSLRGDPDETANPENPRFVALAEAASAGAAHVLYVNLPGGAVASARRTARFRGQIEAAVAGTDIDPDILEALILLESGGRPEVVVGDDPANAAGLTQILAGTATDFLDMSVDLAETRRLYRQIQAARERNDTFEEEALRVERRLIDDRFDPQKAIAGAVRYLTQAREILGRDDLALVSYHMGIGNLTDVIRAYSGDSETDVATLAAGQALSYSQLYFDSSPRRNAQTWRALERLSDDSSNYIWKVYAAREIMRLLREDPDELARLAARHGAKASAEEVLHPPAETEVFDTRADVVSATEEGDLLALPRDPDATHFAIHRKLGELAPALDGRRRDYAVLRPDALAVLEYIAAEVFRIAGDEAPLLVTSAVRDLEYQRLLVRQNAQATRGYSLHTTGYAFDVLRRYDSDEQASAFQFVLERLEILDLIAWVREPDAIHITVAPGARQRLDAWELAG